MYKWKRIWKSRKRIYESKPLVLLHPLNNIEITNYFNYNPRFNGVFSRNNLPRIKDGAYVINLDYKKSKETHWISLVIDRNIALYFDSFGTEYIPLEVLNKTSNKTVTHSLFRIQDDESIMWRLYCITFIDDMIPGKTLLDYTNLFPPNDYNKNEEII